MNTTREHLLSLFRAAPRGIISFEYRREPYRQDKAILDDLIHCGYIREIDKNKKTVFYQLTKQNGGTI